MKKNEIIARQIANSLSGWGEYRRYIAESESLATDITAIVTDLKNQFPERNIEMHRERIADIGDDCGFFEVWVHFVTAYQKPIPAAFYNEEI